MNLAGILSVLWLLFAAASAHGQSGCGGQFPPGTFCGKLGVTGLPGPVPIQELSGIQVAPPIICNGEAIFDQRMEGGVYTSGSNEVYGPDCHRFAGGGSGAGPGVFTFRRIQGAGPAGFQYALQAIVTTQDTTPAHDDNYHWEQPLEDSQVRTLQFGTPNAQTFTYQWRQSCNVNGIYSVSFSSSTNARSYVQTVNYTGSGAFQTFSITVPGDTYAVGSPAPWTYSPVVGAYVPANHIGMKIIHDFGGGSDHATANTGVWQSGGFFRATGALSLIQQTVGSGCDYTGIQIDFGSQALTFRYVPQNVQLPYLQRFIRKTFPLGTAAANGTGLRAGAVNYVAKTPALTTGDSIYVDLSQNPMVAPPILTFYNPLGGTAGFWQNVSGNTTSGAPSTSVGGTTISTTGFSIINPQVAGDTAGSYMAIHYVAGACLGNAGAGTGC